MNHDITLTLNGSAVTRTVEPRQSLADFLRDDCGLTGTHLGCEHGVCGACTVSVDGVPVRSCILYAVQVDGADVRTIEGFDDDPTMSALRDSFTECHALQCGFCTPGMLVASRDIVVRLPTANETRIRAELAGNLCRCTGYAGIVEAVGRVCSARLKSGMTAPGSAQAVVAAPAAQPARHAPVVVETAPGAVSSAAPPQASPGGKGAVRLAQSLVVPHPVSEVWRILGELPVLASCIPGAELKSHDARSFRANVRVGLGAIGTLIEGSATYVRDEARLQGVVRGSGRDRLSRSFVNGSITYTLASQDADRATRLDLDLEFTLQGMLAQFSRSSVVSEVAQTIVAEFGSNLSAALSGAAPAPADGGSARRIKAGGLLLAVLRRWLSRLLRRT